MKLLTSRWVSRSGDYTGTQYLTPKGKIVKVELSRLSQGMLAYENNKRIREQVQ